MSASSAEPASQTAIRLGPSQISYVSVTAPSCAVRRASASSRWVHAVPGGSWNNARSKRVLASREQVTPARGRPPRDGNAGLGPGRRQEWA
jgi:hypothetical protein